MAVDMTLKVGTFPIAAAIFLALAGCQATRNREPDAQAEFDAAVKAQKTQLSEVCGRLQSEAQRRFCESDARQ